jgi:hypothetical protein
MADYEVKMVSKKLLTSDSYLLYCTRSLVYSCFSLEPIASLTRATVNVTQPTQHPHIILVSA